MSVFEMKLRHDRDGRIVEKVESVVGRPVVWTYSYDTAGRLYEAYMDNRLISQCHYDQEGRRQRDYFPATAGSSFRDYRYTRDNRLMSAGNSGYAHDEKGFRSLWANGGTYHRYKYAPDYRLLSMEVEHQNLVYSYQHDDGGKRVAKYCNGQLVEAYQWLDFLRLGGFHDGHMIYEFGYGDGTRLPSVMRREDGAMCALYYDQVGSLRVVADVNGNVIKEILYDPFGGIIKDTNPGLRVPIGFAGGLHDRDLGFVRFGWRDYDTFTGRWTAPDPLGDKGGDSDWYGYCLDDPVNMADPKGLAAGDWWDVVSNYRRAHEIAGEEVAKRGAGNHNNEGDAMRHAEWSRRMAEELGSGTSWLFGLGHEIDGLLNSRQPWGEAMMDLHNNAEGRTAAREKRPVDRRKLQKAPKTGVHVNPYSSQSHGGR